MSSLIHSLWPYLCQHYQTNGSFLSSWATSRNFFSEIFRKCWVRCLTMSWSLCNTIRSLTASTSLIWPRVGHNMVIHCFINNISWYYYLRVMLPSYILFWTATHTPATRYHHIDEPDNVLELLMVPLPGHVPPSEIYFTDKCYRMYSYTFQWVLP